MYDTNMKRVNMEFLRSYQFYISEIFLNQEVDNARQCAARQCDNNSTSEVNDFFYQKI